MRPSPSAADDRSSSAAIGREQRDGGVLPAGARFAGYVVRELIGTGSMARVYRAEHQALGRDVALKVLLPGVLSGRRALERFLQEARITAGLQHANIVQVFEVGVYEEQPYVAMELLVGDDLEARLSAQGAIDEALLIEIALPVAAALATVHEAGVVHRDLEPGHIFLAHPGEPTVTPKLLDFGISRATKQELRRRLAAGDRRMGTPLYMAPEVLQGGEPTPASDQYSLGVILYECVTGVNPFAAPSIRESVRRITTGTRRRVSDQMVAPSRDLAEVIERALEPEPSRRFPDLLSLGRELLPLASARTRVVWEIRFADAEQRTPRAGRARASSGRRFNVGWGTVLAGLLWLGGASLVGWQLTSGLQSDDEAFVVQGPAASDLRSERLALQPVPLRPAPVAPELPGESAGGGQTAAEPPQELTSAQALPGPRAAEEQSPSSLPAALHQPAAPQEPAPPLEGATPPELAPPDWALSPRRLDAGAAVDQLEREARHERPLRGTNDAPIFD